MNLGVIVRSLPLSHLVVLQALGGDAVDVFGVIFHVVSLLKLLHAALCWTDILAVVQLCQN